MAIHPQRPQPSVEEQEGNDGNDGPGPNTTIHLPERVYRDIGKTQEQVEAMPAIAKYSIQLGFAIAQWSVHNWRFSNMEEQHDFIIDEGPLGERVVLGSVSKFLVINGWRPTLSDIMVLGNLVGILIKGLAIQDADVVQQRSAHFIPDVGQSGVLPHEFRQLHV